MKAVRDKGCAADLQPKKAQGLFSAAFRPALPNNIHTQGDISHHFQCDVNGAKTADPRGLPRTRTLWAAQPLPVFLAQYVYNNWLRSWSCDSSMPDLTWPLKVPPVAFLSSLCPDHIFDSSSFDLLPQQILVLTCLNPKVDIWFAYSISVCLSNFLREVVIPP